MATAGKKHKVYSRSVVNGSRVNTFAMADMGYQDRARHIDPKLIKLFRMDVTTPNEPLLAAQEVIKRMTKEIPVSNHIRLVGSKLLDVFLFYSKEDFFLVKNNYVNNTIHRSIDYRSRDHAMRAFAKNRVIWISQEVLVK